MGKEQQGHVSLKLMLSACILSLVMLMSIAMYFEHYNSVFIISAQAGTTEDNPLVELPTMTTTAFASGAKQCKPQQRLAFAKTHKTGGSTLQNIFLRYGYLNGLSFALPKRAWFFGFDYSFNASMVTNYAWNKNKTFDIMAFHCLWNSSEVDKVIPKPSVRITLLRDPVDTFESGYVYMGLQKAYGLNINEFAKRIVNLNYPKRRLNTWFDKNELLWDLGMNTSKMSDSSAVRHMIEYFETNFDLVLISERFDESLIVMKELLCWDFEDIVYLKQNERGDEFKSTSITPESRLILQHWLWADFELYNYFSHKLDSQLASKDSVKFSSDLRTLQRMNIGLKSKCNAHEVDNALMKGTVLHMAHPMVKAYNLNKNCTLYGISEPSFVNMIRSQQEKGRPTRHSIN